MKFRVKKMKQMTLDKIMKTQTQRVVPENFVLQWKDGVPYVTLQRTTARKYFSTRMVHDE